MVNVFRPEQAQVYPQNKLVPDEFGMTLCKFAEPRLVQTFLHRSFIVVNGLMLVKWRGQAVGIALQETSIDGGTTKFANWYEPVHFDEREKILDAARAGETHLDLPHIEWVEKRPVDTARIHPDPEFDLTAFANQSLATLISHGHNMPECPRSAYQYIYDDLPKGQTLADFTIESRGVQ